MQELFTGLGTNLLSSAIFKMTVCPAFDDMYNRKFLFFVYTPKERKI